MTFTVANAGNGTDSMTISENISVAGVITVTGYRYGATTYGTLAALNTALSSVGIAQGGSITLKIVYNVASGQGGDRKSTRLNSSHGYISYAVFCLKKKKNTASEDQEKSRPVQHRVEHNRKTPTARAYATPRREVGPRSTGPRTIQHSPHIRGGSDV